MNEFWTPNFGTHIAVVAEVTTIRCVAFDLGTANLGIGVVDRTTDGSFQAVAAKYATTSRREDSNRTTEDDLRRALELRVAISNTLDLAKPQVVVYEAYRVYADPIAPRLRKLAEALVELFSWAPAGARDLGKDAAFLIARAANSAGFVTNLANLLDECHAVLQDAGNVAGRGDAAKVLVVQGVVLAEAASRGIPVYTFLPSDLRERFHPRDDAGKLIKSASSKAEHKQRTFRGVQTCLPNLQEVLTAANISGYKTEHVSDALGHAILGCERMAQELSTQESNK